MFLSESIYLVVNDNRITELSRWLLFAALILGKGIAIVIFEIMVMQKLKSARPFYFVAFQTFFMILAIKGVSMLPLAFDRVLHMLPEVFLGARLRTYDQEAFQKVALVYPGDQSILHSSGCSINRMLVDVWFSL